MNQGQDWFELVADSGNARIRRAGGQDQVARIRWPGSGGQDQELGSGGQELGEIRIRRAGSGGQDQVARIRWPGTRRDQDQEGRWQAGGSVWQAGGKWQGSVWQAGQHQVKVAAKLLVAACFSTTSKST